jgi:anaerobic C4-dicarboxylate transporter
LSAKSLLAALPGFNSLFFLQNYPTILDAIELDKTGSTKIGKYILNHSFMLPGLITTFCAIITAHILAFLLL